MSGEHFLIVGEFDPDDPDLFDIEHSADCPVRTYLAAGYYPVEEYTCEVQMHLDTAGLDEYFRHADDPDGLEQHNAHAEPVGPGRHAIEAWTQRHPAGPWGSEEWSSGLCIAKGEAS